MQPFTSQPKIHIRHLLFTVPIVLLLIFTFIGLFSAPSSNRLLYLDNVNKALDTLKAETIVEMMGWENPYMAHVLPNDYKRISFSELALQAVTHIDFEDERSLLGNELPGFTNFDTQIVVAGEGTNYTNVPIESPPPLDYILKQDQGSKEEKPKEQSKPPVTQDPANATVFIYSTHSWESYLPLLGKAGAKNANLATNNSGKNIHLVDDMLKAALSENGVEAVTDEPNMTDILHKKNWNTNSAYQASRPFIQAAVSSKKDYQVFLDIHRDSARKDSTTATIKGDKYARVSFIIGSANPNYEKNKQLAKKLHNSLKKTYPGISKGIFEKSKSLGNGVYNQDLSPHALLIEVGGVDNTMDELKRTVNALADVISEYVKQATQV